MDPLKNASEAGNIDGLYAVIRENPHILCLIDEVPFVETPLHTAAVSGHIQFASEIMRLKPSFARKSNQEGFTPIHVALQKNHSEMALWLIQKDSELVHAKGREGITPLHYVVEQGYVDLVETFLSVCPKAIEDVTVRNQTALHIALINNNLESFQLLINQLSKKENDEEDNDWKKMVLNCKDLEGNTVLHIATIRNQPQALRLLIRYNNANPGMLEAGAVNKNGRTALDMALSCSYDSTHIQDLLKEISSKSVAKSNPIALSPERTQNQDLAIPVSPESAGRNNLTRQSILDWANYFRFEFGKDKKEVTRSDLLVVAVLMATATYQAGLSPPGGLGESKSESLLASSKPGLYVMFIFFNSMGFFISLNTIRVLIYQYPLYWETYMAMLGMIVTYDISFFAISPTGYLVTTFEIICAAMPLVAAIVPPLMRLCCKRLGRKSKH